MLTATRYLLPPIYLVSALPSLLAHLDSDSVNHKSSSCRSRRVKGTLYRCIFYRSRIPVGPSCCASNRGSCLSSVFKWLLVVAECPVLAHLERGIMTAIHCFVVGLRKRADKTAVCRRFKGVVRVEATTSLCTICLSLDSDTAASCSVDLSNQLHNQSPSTLVHPNIRSRRDRMLG